MGQQFDLKKKVASRKQLKLRLGLGGSSGSGKTYSSLLLARGLCDKWEEVTVIDTEQGSCNDYTNLGNFNVIELSAPYTPEQYIQALDMCKEDGTKVIVIDSISHEWEGSGGILEMHSEMTGNSYMNWKHFTPRHLSFLNAILHSPCHTVSTVRTKQDYVLNLNDKGKTVPQKVGMKIITREGFDYEMKAFLDIDIDHMAVASKDRTGLFADKTPIKLTQATGEKLRKWAEEGLTQDQIDASDKADKADKLKDLRAKDTPEAFKICLQLNFPNFKSDPEVMEVVKEKTLIFAPKKTETEPKTVKEETIESKIPKLDETALAQRNSKIEALRGSKTKALFNSALLSDFPNYKTDEELKSLILEMGEKFKQQKAETAPVAV